MEWPDLKWKQEWKESGDDHICVVRAAASAGPSLCGGERIASQAENPIEVSFSSLVTVEGKERLNTGKIHHSNCYIHKTTNYQY